MGGIPSRAFGLKNGCHVKTSFHTNIETFYFWSNDFGHSFTILILLVSCFKEAFGTDYIEMFKWLQIKSEPE